MAMVQICPQCRSAYSIGEMRGPVCGQCKFLMAQTAKHDQAKTGLADDLVRGITNTQAKQP